jgi:uncharacterized membrane protein YhaH (DUF805 family)
MRITDILLSPNGRITRLGFWGAWLAVLFIVVVAGFSLMTLAEFSAQKGGFRPPVLGDDAYGRFAWIGLVLAVPVAWMVFCVLVKRWHDRGRSGWWLLVALVPVIGQLWALIECGFLAGSRAGNKYGPSPSRGRYDHALHFGDEIPEDMA